MFKDSVKCFLRKISNKVSRVFKNIAMEFLQFYCCMDLIAATRAEGGLVYYRHTDRHLRTLIRDELQNDPEGQNVKNILEQMLLFTSKTF